MADAPDSKSGAFTGVWVQVPSPVPVRWQHIAERWRSGRSRPLGKRVYLKRVPRVRIPPSPPFICAPISGDDSPQARELNVEDGVRFRAERAKDFCGGDVRGDILRQDRDKRGLGIGDARKGAVLGGIRAGRACGRAAARHGDRRGQPFRTALRTASVGRRGRLRRSAGLRQIPTLRSPQALLAARDLATPALAGGQTAKKNLRTHPPARIFIA